MIILGIDPGSRITGYGIIEVNGSRHTCLNCGTLRIHEDNFAMQLAKIFRGITELITTFQPQEMAIEKVFVKCNVDSALKLGQARGAAIVAAAHHDIPVFEYSPRQIKKAVVGYGAAAKNQIQHMMKILLRLSKEPSQDAADALAIAVCHSHTRVGELKMTKER